MARKKNSRQKHQKDTCEDDTSDEELKTYQNAKNCSHISKAVNLSRLKKSLKGITDTEKCKDCKEAEMPIVPISETASKAEGDEEVLINEIWLCLQCGYRGCGRHSTQKHAVQHFKTPHSDCHSVVLGLTSTSTWCYACDSAVRPDASRSLKDCIEFVVKHKDKKVPNHVLVNGDKKSPPKQTSIEKASNLAGPEKIEKESSLPKPKEKDYKKSVSVNKNVCVPIIRTIKGLRNLGNTCFFNAVLQNLCQTPWLFLELEHRYEKGFVWELPYPIDNKFHDDKVPVKFTLPECYPLTQAFINFLKVTNKTTSQKSEIVNPSSLFDQLCKKSPQFCGFHQQDSHELLRQLLDGIRNEEIKRQRKAVLKGFNISDKGKSEDLDENTKCLIKAYGSFASHTIVEKIFGGQLLSTVVCEECKGSSQVFEPFMDLSLPLIEEKPVRMGKAQKHDNDDDYGVQAIAKKKVSDNSSTLSKHQERKLRQQARKSSKKMGKSKSCNNPPIKEAEPKHDVVPEEAIEKSIEKETEEGNGNGNPYKESNDDLSDADVEDNDDTESIPKCQPTDDLPKDSEFAEDDATSKDVYNPESKTAVLEELCNQITEIRIRKDSDKQDDLLESMDEFRRSSNKQRKSIHGIDLSDILDQECDVDWSHSQSDEQAKEWMIRSLTTLKARYQPGSKECSVNSCLNQFTASELLTGSNKFRCENCTKLLHEATGKSSEVVYSNASKQLLIFSPPAVLTLHLKRFQQTGMSLRKLNSFVQFPEILDLAPYCSSICLRLPHMSEVKDEVLYSLYGIVQHSGRLTCGHYTAYVRLQEHQTNPVFLNNWPMGQCNLEQLLDKISKVKLPNDLPYKMSDSTWYKWYYISDSMFKEVNQSEVMQCQAYILFYQRIK